MTMLPRNPHDPRYAGHENDTLRNENSRLRQTNRLLKDRVAHLERLIRDFDDDDLKRLADLGT